MLNIWNIVIISDYHSAWNESLSGSGSRVANSGLGTAAGLSEDYSTPSSEQVCIAIIY